MSNFGKRAVTGVIIITVIIGAVGFGVYSFLFLCLAINLLALSEFYHLFQIDKNHVRRISGLLLSACLLVTFALLNLAYYDRRITLVVLPLISLVFIIELYLRSDTPFTNLAFIFLGIVYITLPLILLFSCAFSFPDAAYHPHVILGYFFLLWANDTGAYICGSQFGKYPLAPRLSPNKTWEGSAGGAFLVMVFVYVNYAFFNDLTLFNWMVLGVIVIVMGTLGDLVKSMMKRSLNIKDSGNILPGHGGMLDRFDSLIGSVPFVFAYLKLL